MKLLSYDDLNDIGINWSVRHLARLEAAGKFPRRVRLGHRTIAWAETEVYRFIKKPRGKKRA